MKMNKCRQMIMAVFFAMVLTVASVQAVFATASGGPSAGSLNNSDSKLSEFGVHPGSLSPAFSPDVLDYTASVDANVTAVDVRAVPRAQGGTIASVEGARTLKPGVNTVKVTCSAPDNSYTVYTITITVGSANAAGQDAGAQGTDTQPKDDVETDPQSPDGAGTDTQPSDNAGTDGQSPDSAGTDSQSPDGASNVSTVKKQKKKKAASLIGAVAADGTVTLSGATYKLSGNFSYGSYSQDIPSAFGEGSLQIGSASYPTLHCESNGVDLVYMENTDGKGSTGFYYYDEAQNAVERFKYTGIGDNFVIFISSARAEVPNGFQSKTLKLPSEKKVAAYKNPSSAQMQDMYLIYGINSDGSDGWYLYDNKQGTYMRYVEDFGISQEPDVREEIEPSVSLDKYNLLNEKYTKLKSGMVKTVSGFVIGIAVLIILFTAVLLRGKDYDGEEERTGVKERKAKKKPKRMKKNEQPVSKSSLAAGRQLDGKAVKGESKKITKTITQQGQPKEAGFSKPQENSALSQPGQEMDASMQRKRELDVRPQSGRGQGAARIQSDYVQQPVTPPVEFTRPQPARRSLLRKDSQGSDDAVRLAAEKMRQSVRRPAGSAGAPVNGEAERMEERIEEREERMEERMKETAAAKSRAAQRRKRGLDEDMDIMDLNDL